MTTLAGLRSRVVALMAAILCACSPASEPPPHIILISLDTLNRSALPAYNPDAEPLPALDALCAESLRFERAYSTASWTLPSHGSLFTGLYPDRHGATDRRVTLAADVQTLARGLAGRGYETAGFNGGGYLSSEYGMHRGFEHYDTYDRDKGGPAETGTALVERVRAWLSERPQGGRPLFLFLHSYAVHNYYDVRPEIGAALGDDNLLTRKSYIHCATGRGSCPPSAWPQMRRLYRAELEDFDRAFAALRADLEEAGIWDNALVFFLTDHGEGFDPERNRKHHGGRLHEDQLHIPLLVRLPSGEAGVVREPVSLVDVFPTLLDLSGGALPADIDGRSFASLLGFDGQFEPRPVFGMEHYFAWQRGRRQNAEEVFPLPLSMAVIDDENWYIRDPRGEQLYDAVNDPAQEHDRAGNGLERLRALAAQRERARPLTPLRGEAPELDASLRELGYAGDDEE